MIILLIAIGAVGGIMLYRGILIFPDGECVFFFIVAAFFAMIPFLFQFSWQQAFAFYAGMGLTFFNLLGDL